VSLVVSNSSPLIYLAALSDFVLLRQLFEELAIPPAVYDEVVTNGGSHPVVKAVRQNLGVWIHVRQLVKPQRSGPLMKQEGIHAGEAEAILLAQDVNADTLLMYDRSGVGCARSAALHVVRTAGIYMLAKDDGLIDAVTPKLNALRGLGFHLSDTHYELILKKAGEL
jgi:predicted nucleic acid-binding protein